MARTKGMGSEKVATRRGKEKAHSKLTRLAIAAQEETMSDSSEEPQNEKRRKANNEEENTEEENTEEEENNDSDDSDDSDKEVQEKDLQENSEDEEDDSDDDKDDGSEEEGGGNEEEGEDGDEGLEFDEELPKLSDPPPSLHKAFFTENYGFKDEGANPMRLSKWKGKPFDDKKCVALFGKPMGAGGRNGYNWRTCKSKRIKKRVHELMTALYQRDDAPRFLPHKMARGIILEEEKEKVNWAAYGAATNATQRKTHARNMVKLEKAKGGTPAQRGAWRKIQVDPREYHSEICEGMGSSMCGKFADGDEGGSRTEYLARLLAVENLELQAMVEAERVAAQKRETMVKAFDQNNRLGNLNAEEAQEIREGFSKSNVRWHDGGFASEIKS